ncbi:hypothetical protein [Vibrio owensii]|uniref:hypothetical protein n=1 Tax=Vibrio owensii TaxID=696485 RepID=UPI0018F118C0|nr:hypothetical protein [Vibrio owensii]
MNQVHVVDQTDIPCSFGAKSLFVNCAHIAEENESSDIPLEEIAENLASALGCTVTNVVISERQLAKAKAVKNGNLAELEEEQKSGLDDYDKWIQGYSNDDLLVFIQS